MALKIKAKLSAADRFVKTFEAWWAFGACVLAIASAMTAAVIWATPKLMAVGWPYWVLVGIPMAFVVALALRFLTWWWAKFRTDGAIDNVQATNNGDGENPYDLESMAQTLSGLKSDQGRIAGLVNTAIRDGEGRLEQQFAQLRQEIYENIDTYNAKLSEIHDAGYALYAYGFILDEIDELTPILDTKKNLHEDFEEIFENWKFKVGQWVEHIREHLPYEIDDPAKYGPERLKSRHFQTWVNEISNGDLQLSVKEFSIMKNAFKATRLNAIQYLRHTANQKFEVEKANDN